VKGQKEERQIDWWIDRQTKGRKTDGLKERQTDRHMDGETDEQKERKILR
jgi:hypothetical protein